MDTGLVVTETTISMLTDEVYDAVDDNSKTEIPDYMRIMLANRVAATGVEWIAAMRESATGLYSSQWIVTDTNKLKPTDKVVQGKPVMNAEPGLLFVLDQTPGLQHSEDMTETLKKTGYWGSYNRAWFEDVRSHMGATEAEEMDGVLFSRDKSPRANIFRATQQTVHDVQSMKDEMQRNRWPVEVDGGEKNTPDHAIAARSDLDARYAVPNGAVDSKVADLSMIRSMQIEAISGPTRDAGKKPFKWTDAQGHDIFNAAE